MYAPGNMFRVGRVVSEDDGFLLLEIAKSDQEPYSLQEGDQFYTLLFVTREARDGEMKLRMAARGEKLRAWLPWEER